MRKVAVAPCAFVLLTLSMLAASGADKTVTNKELGFEITFPEEWNPSTNSDGSVGGGIKTFEPRAGVSVVSYILRGHPSLTEFVDQHERHYIPGRNYETKERGNLKLGGADAYKVVRMRGPEYPRVFHADTQYFIISGNRGFIIYVYASHADYDKYAKDIDAIVKSFKLIEAK